MPLSGHGSVQELGNHGTLALKKYFILLSDITRCMPHRPSPSPALVTLCGFSLNEQNPINAEEELMTKLQVSA